MDSDLDRRTLLRNAGYGAGALILGGVPVDAWARAGRRPAAVPALAAGGTFSEGVAAGAPKPRGAILWTRLGGVSGDQRLNLEVARDAGFRRVVARRTVIASAARDHTVKVRVEGRRVLAPGERYYYRFATRAGSSPVGRFQTLRPPDSREPVRIAFFSCQDYQAGFYGAHRTIADDDNLDLVVCLGDYVYEKNFYTGPRQDRLGANGDGEVQTLDEYRAKYRLYRSDPDLQAMHARHAFIPITDDHEVEDNYARDKPGAATSQVRVPFLERRANGYRAFDEFQPQQFVGRGTSRTYRSFRIGRTAELFLLDERQYRDDQPCNDAFFTPCADAEGTPRKFLGDQQLAWLKRGLANSGGTWKLVANQLMIMALDTPQNNAINKDSWDGYGLERRDLTSHISSRNIRDVAFITGDIHTFFAGDVGPNGRGPSSVATEFVCGSVTSLGIPESLSGATGLPPDQLKLISNNLPVVNPHYRFFDQENRGYGVVEARPDELRVEFRAVTARPARSATPRVVARLRVARGNPRVQVL